MGDETIGDWRTLAHFARGDSVAGHLGNALTVARLVEALGEPLSPADRDAIRDRVRAVLVLLDDATSAELR